MPALIGPFVAFFLGVALAWLGRAEAPREEAPVFHARLAVAALFGVLVVAPVCAYFLVFAADWALFYLVDSRSVPSALVLVLVLADAGLVVLGFVAGHRAAERRLDPALATLGLVPLLIVVLMVLGFASRLRIEGSFHQFTERFGTQSIVGSPVGWAILWMGAMLGAGFFLAARALMVPPRAPRPPDLDGSERPPMLGRAPSSERPSRLGQPRKGGL